MLARRPSPAASHPLARPAPPWALDEENPEWTPEDVRRARPASEALPEIVGEQTTREMLRRGKTDAHKESVTIPLDAGVLRHFQASGLGWENKINEALRGWVERQEARRR